MRLNSKVSLVGRLLREKKYRDAFVYQYVKNNIPFQIRTLREQRDWTQGQLGDAAGKPRNVITRLEDPNYGTASLKTLFELASGFNCGLLVKFVPFTRLLREYEDVSPSALSAADIKTETKPLELWAINKDHENDKLDSASDPKASTITDFSYRLLQGGGSPQQRIPFRDLHVLEGGQLKTSSISVPKSTMRLSEIDEIENLQITGSASEKRA